MFQGNDARRMLGLPSSGTVKLHPRSVPAGWRAYVQSTSYNRVLEPGTQFLYEITQA